METVITKLNKARAIHKKLEEENVFLKKESAFLHERNECLKRRNDFLEKENVRLTKSLLGRLALTVVQTRIRKIDVRV